MMTRRYIYIYNKVRGRLWLMAWSMMLCVGCIAFVACSSDSDTPDDDQNGKLRLVSCTRGAIENNHVFVDGSKLWLALTSNSTSGPTMDSEGSYTYSSDGNKWTGGIMVKEAKQYYLYGAMSPNGSLDCSITSTDYSKGATLTITGLPTMAEDGDNGDYVPCVVVGAKGVTDPNTPWNVPEGQFGYMGILKKGEDNAQLLLGRLYAAFSFRFTIDPNYAKLRTIKLKEMKMIFPTGTKTEVDLTVELKATLDGTTSPINQVTAVPNSAAASRENYILFPPPNSGEDIAKDITTLGDTDIPSYCLPSGVASGLSLSCKYDVYDRGGNNLGERTAVNSLNSVITSGSLPHGSKRDIVLHVAPTYLYILSDADLDNPTITIN